VDGVEQILAHFDVGAPRAVSVVDSGLIHGTWFVDAGKRYVLQRLHPKLSSDGIAADYAAVTEHLHRKRVLAPRLVRTRSGAPLASAEGVRWRLTTRLPGVTIGRIPDEATVTEAARALGRFHAAIADIDHDFQSDHPLHRTVEHLQGLRDAAADPRFAGSRGCVEAEIETILEALPGALLPDLPVRVVHGDPKISNVLFVEGQATALIDLDTCNRHTLLVDLGDATRSWCRDGAEDERQDFRLDRFEALLRGYFAGGPPLSPAEREALPLAGRTIALELASRFARDALEDHYFGWDASRYPDRRSHNVARTRGMLHLAASIERHATSARRLVTAIHG